ncbi:hypothetical protein DFH07DRAFT_938206 [Mycena maculata]|uniref:Zn(2)-C6 fungal-type domain-containing protein n=1 Tax=Mycena maculata TaxID=230809 RepID=A0AAD7JQ79_9AGAR|nr:hypothetical protein DFH07DRAFT_938206 [Mycena maculata]
MPVTRSPNPRPSEETAKKKKPPACDSCKARRVLCHPTTDGTPCPRCIEKGTKCTTTPVVRGRPLKKQSGMKTPPYTSPSASGETEPSGSQSNTSSQYEEVVSSQYEEVASSSSNDFNPLFDLSPQLVHHLFECFSYLPQYSHPMFRRTVLGEALSSLSWQIHLLPTQLKVLAHCVVALSASISFDRAILGPGPQPASLTDRSVFTRRSDLRAYGIRRAPVYRALSAQTLRLASEAGITLEPSEDNAMSCFLMQFLENENQANSRPWACAYLSHVRAIAASWKEVHITHYHTAVWTGFLMTEVLESTLHRKPVLVSHNDQLLITGVEPLSLQSLFVSVQTTLQGPNTSPQKHVLFTILHPFLFHVTRLARQLSETITGDFARRHPLDETSATEFLSALTILHSIRSLVFDQSDLDSYPADPLFQSRHTRGAHVDLRTCAHMMTFASAKLVFALHSELSRRAALPMVASGRGVLTSQWAAERLDLLRRQAREMAGFAVEEVARAVRFLASLPHLTHLERGGLIASAQFCLDEGDAAGGVAPERAVAIEAISDALKLIGYSWELPQGLVERLDAYVDTHRGASPSFGDDSMFLNMFPPPMDNWMSMFTVPYGDGSAS